MPFDQFTSMYSILKVLDSATVHTDAMRSALMNSKRQGFDVAETN